jgi:hypothetical protein
MILYYYSNIFIILLSIIYHLKFFEKQIISTHSTIYFNEFYYFDCSEVSYYYFYKMYKIQKTNKNYILIIKIDIYIYIYLTLRKYCS